jgi:membrane protein DedA with SNARE-associated domain
MEHLVQHALAFIAAHSDWAAVVMFVTAFVESFLFLSLLFPGTSLLIAGGALVSAGSLPYLPTVAGAVGGAVLGDAVSFWIGGRFGRTVGRVRPFTRRPELLARGVRFFARHGGKSVFIGRFFGPVRAVIPLAAGIMDMPPGRFWVANIGSAIVRAPMLLFAGNVAGAIGGRLIGQERFLVLVLGGIALFGVAGLVWVVVQQHRRS